MRRAALRFLRFLGTRALRGNQGSVPAGKFVADETRRNPGARFDPPLVWQPLVRAEQAQERRADRHCQGLIHSLLDLRRAGPRRLDRRERLLLLRDTARWIISSMTNWCRRHAACN